MEQFTNQTDQTLREHSEAIVEALTKLMQRLFSVTTDNLAMELPVAQLRVCSLLWDGPRTMSSLAEALNISHSAITQIADRLERTELVERVIEEDDRRCKKLALTPKGLEVLEQRLEHRIQRVMSAIASLNSHQRDTIVASLNVMFDVSDPCS